jgi:hypothetical protein
MHRSKFSVRCSFTARVCDRDRRTIRPSQHIKTIVATATGEYSFRIAIKQSNRIDNKEGAGDPVARRH